MAALLQGGGLGIIGDAFFTDRTKYGSKFTDFLMPPVVGKVNQAYQITVNNLWEAGRGDDTNAASEWFDFVKGMTPGQNLWFSKLLLNRLLFDEVKDLIDDGYSDKMYRSQEQMKEDYNQEYYWEPLSN
jgi:hypothetical protein